jgi:hypothetical protein
MRKQARRLSASKSSGKRVLQLSQETIRTLSHDELTQAVAGCPNGSSPTTLEVDPGS